MSWLWDRTSLSLESGEKAGRPSRKFLVHDVNDSGLTHNGDRRTGVERLNISEGKTAVLWKEGLLE